MRQPLPRSILFVSKFEVNRASASINANGWRLTPDFDAQLWVTSKRHGFLGSANLNHDWKDVTAQFPRYKDHAPGWTFSCSYTVPEDGDEIRFELMSRFGLLCRKRRRIPPNHGMNCKSTILPSSINVSSAMHSLARRMMSAEIRVEGGSTENVPSLRTNRRSVPATPVPVKTKSGITWRAEWPATALFDHEELIVEIKGSGDALTAAKPFKREIANDNSAALRAPLVTNTEETVQFIKALRRKRDVALDTASACCYPAFLEHRGLIEYLDKAARLDLPRWLGVDRIVLAASAEIRSEIREVPEGFQLVPDGPAFKSKLSKAKFILWHNDKSPGSSSLAQDLLPERAILATVKSENPVVWIERCLKARWHSLSDEERKHSLADAQQRFTSWQSSVDAHDSCLLLGSSLTKFGASLKQEAAGRIVLMDATLMDGRKDLSEILADGLFLSTETLLSGSTGTNGPGLRLAPAILDSEQPLFLPAYLVDPLLELHSEIADRLIPLEPLTTDPLGEVCELPIMTRFGDVLTGQMIPIAASVSRNVIVAGLPDSSHSSIEAAMAAAETFGVNFFPAKFEDLTHPSLEARCVRPTASAEAKTGRRVCFVMHCPPELFSGGRYHALLLAEAFAAQGDDVVIWANTRPKWYFNLAAHPGHAKINWHLNGFETPPKGDFDAVFIVPEMGRKPDVYHAGLELAKETHALSALINFETPNWFNATAPVPRPFEKWANWVATSKFADVILSSAEISTEFARAFYEPLPKNVVFGTAPPAINQPIADAVRTKCIEPQKQIICISRFGQEAVHKNIESLTDLLSEDTQGYTFALLIGTGAYPEASRLAQMKQEFDRHGVQLKLLHKISDYRKFVEISKSECMVFPSFFEGFGYPPVEAHYMDRPCLAYDLPVLQEFGKDLLFTVPIGASAMMREALAQILRNPPEIDGTRHSKVLPIAGHSRFAARVNEILDQASASSEPRSAKFSKSLFDVYAQEFVRKVR